MRAGPAKHLFQLGLLPREDMDVIEPFGQRGAVPQFGQLQRGQRILRRTDQMGAQPRGNAHLPGDRPAGRCVHASVPPRPAARRSL